MSRKEFDVVDSNDKEIKLAVRVPAYDDFEQADKVYASKIASLVRESGGKRLLLRSHLDEFLRSAGVWTEVDEKKVKTLQEEVDGLLAKLRKGGIKLSEGRELAIKTMDRRKDIVRVMSKRQIFDDTTIESIAENEKMDYLVYTCTVYAESGKNYWESFEDMKIDKISEAYQKASAAAMEVIFSVNPEFEKKLPENKWLKKFGFVDEELNYVDRKTGLKVDRDGNAIEELQQKMQEKLENLQGDLKEESPFIDDETNEPVATTN